MTVELHEHGDDPKGRSPASFEQRVFAPHTIAAIVAECGEQGVSATETLAGTDLSAEQIGSHTTKVSYRQIDRVIRNALHSARDTALALRAGQRMHITAYGMYGYAMLTSANQDQARDFAAKYGRVVGPLCDYAVSADGTTGAVRLEAACWPDPADEAHRFAVEFALSAHLTATRDWAGPQHALSRVIVDYAAPPHAGIYDDLFACPVVFGQSYCGFEYRQQDSPVRLRDARTHALAREMCEQLLEEVNRAAGIATDVRRLLIDYIGRFPTVETIADRLQMHPRALKRRLEAEGTSYRGLLAEMRMRLAIEFLRKTQMTNEQIGNRLGYSDAANFRHAFVRWTGRSPSDYRRASRED